MVGLCNFAPDVEVIVAVGKTDPAAHTDCPIHFIFQSVLYFEESILTAVVMKNLAGEGDWSPGQFLSGKSVMRGDQAILVANRTPQPRRESSPVYTSWGTAG